MTLLIRVKLLNEDVLSDLAVVEPEVTWNKPSRWTGPDPVLYESFDIQMVWLFMKELCG